MSTNSSYWQRRKRTVLSTGIAVVAFVVLVSWWLDRRPALTSTTVTASTAPAETSTLSARPALPTEPAASGGAAPITSGAPIDMSKALHEAKVLENARAALRSGDPKK